MWGKPALSEVEGVGGGEEEEGCPTFAWTVNFNDGNEFAFDKSFLLFVRAVRGSCVRSM